MLWTAIRLPERDAIKRKTNKKWGIDMEKREIFAVIIAAVGICMLIGIIRMVTGADMPDESSGTEPAQITQEPAVQVTTDYWDVIRAEQNSTAAETTEDPFAPVTQNSLSLITEYAGSSTTTTSTIAGVGDIQVPFEVVPPQSQQRETTTTTAVVPMTTTTTSMFSIVIH